MGSRVPELMAAFRTQAERFGSRIIDVDIDRVDFSSRPFRVWARGIEYRGDAVIVATGASALWLGLESETRLRGQGVSACATCDGFFFRDKEMAVVGGGDTALEEALVPDPLRDPGRTCSTGATTFRASKIMVERAYRPSRRSSVRLQHVGRRGPGRRATSRASGCGTRRPTRAWRRWPSMGCSWPSATSRTRTSSGTVLDVDEMGYLTVRDETGSRIEGVFIAGDVHDHRYRQAVTAAGEGCKAAIDAERWLEVKPSRTATPALAG